MTNLVMKKPPSPYIQMVWSCLLPRRWDKNKKENGYSNKVMKKLMGGKVQGYSIDLNHNMTAKEINLFRIDGTHMSILENKLVLNNLQASI